MMLPLDFVFSSIMFIKWLSLVKEYFGHQRMDDLRMGGGNTFVNVGALSKRRHRPPASKYDLALES